MQQHEHELSRDGTRFLGGIEVKTFAGKKVIYEFEGNEDFVIVVQLKDFRACAKAYKHASGSGAFVALAEDWGVNFHIPEWYHNWMSDGRDRFKTKIPTFDEAKEMSLEWLREMCKRDDQDDTTNSK